MKLLGIIVLIVLISGLVGGVLFFTSDSYKNSVVLNEECKKLGGYLGSFNEVEYLTEICGEKVYLGYCDKVAIHGIFYYVSGEKTTFGDELDKYNLNSDESLRQFCEVFK